MTSKLKCPVCPMCGSELVRCKTFPYFYYCNCAEYEDIECELDDCAASVPVWEALRRTKKQLEIAVDALGYYASENSWDETNRWMFVENGFEFAKDVLEQITHDNSEKANNQEHKE